MDGVLEEAVRFMTDSFVNSPNSLAAFRMVFIEEAKRLQLNRVLDLFVSMTQQGRSLAYSIHVLQFFNEVVLRAPLLPRQQGAASGGKDASSAESDVSAFSLEFCRQLNAGLLVVRSDAVFL